MESRNSIFFMKKLILLICFSHGGAGTADITVDLKEGDGVSLLTDVTLTPGDHVMWYFKTKRIAEMFENVPEVNTDESFHETFRDKLKLEEQSGSLTISNISTACSGDYTLGIMNDDKVNDKPPQIFVVTVHSASPAEQHEMKNKSVTEGDPLSLDSSDIYQGKIGAERVKWFFNGSPMEPEPQEIGDVPLVDSSSGSLIISNTRISDSGEYEVNVIYNRFIIIRRFYVTVNGILRDKRILS
ncbi:hypothetical protein DNTS_007808 [Danionella cerebrum]|uniref:Ig-like domain-containing protein n=1 Tax=Danionella cerebrum TaxID=2873325 RepID=A0A553N5N5_9TELE|nr:hypothetical protein DNTS_007808 [Danionella translucida]